MLRELEGAAGDGDVVIGGKESEQAQDQAADGLRETEAVETKPVETEPIQAGPKVESLRKVWRKRRLNAALGWTVGGRGRCGHRGRA